MGIGWGKNKKIRMKGRYLGVICGVNLMDLIFRFKIKFDFIEDELDDKVLDRMLWGKKFFESKILLYPFNDLKGNYYLSLFNFKTYNDLVEERQRNEKKL